MSYANPRVKDLHMTLPEIVFAMSGGNPGAITVLMNLLEETSRIDPDNMLGGLGSILQLDSMDIYNEKIWLLFSDICQRDMTKFVTVLRGNQLGLISTKAVNDGIDRAGTIDLDDLLVKVQEILPDFAKN